MAEVSNHRGRVRIGSGREQGARGLERRDGLARNLGRYARIRLTSVAALGTDQPLVYQIRGEQLAGRPGVARIFTAGRGFTGEGGYPSTIAGMEGGPFEASPPQAAAAAGEWVGPPPPAALHILRE